MTTKDLTTLWSLDIPHATTSSPFVRLLSENKLPDNNFNTWLFNDFLYVRCATFFLARLITSTPDSDPLKQSHLIPAYNVLQRELHVFRAKALARSVVLPEISSPHHDHAIESDRTSQEVLSELVDHAADGCTGYMRFMTETLLDEKRVHWTTLLTVLWLLEKVYLDVMVHVRDSPAFREGTNEDLRDLVVWWANDEFAAYVDALREAVERLREEAGKGGSFREEEAKWAAGEVIRWERGFWDIATEDLRIDD